MQPLVLLTALTATTGLFGGARHHRGYHYYPSARYCASCPQTYTYNAAPTCAQGTCAPAPQPVQAPAVPQQAQVQHTGYYRYNSYYYAPQATCPSGTCYRR